MKKFLIILMVVAMASFLFVGCMPGVTPPVDDEDEDVTPPVTGAIIDIAAIPGVPAPVAGAIPDLIVTATVQYTGVTTWSPTVVGTFAAGTVYTATITLTPKTGYTLTGVLANFFTVAGATDTNPANSGVVKAVFPVTPAVAIIDIGGGVIGGVTRPVVGEVPDSTVVETLQYTGVTTWLPAVVGTFAADTVYTATITLTPKAGYTLIGVLANVFTVAGAIDTNPADSGVVTAIFPATFIIPTVAWTTTGDGDGAIVAGETLILTFSIPMTRIPITAATIDLRLVPSVGTHLDVGGAIGSAVWNATNTVLIITYSAGGGIPTISNAAGDTITADTALATGFLSADGVALTTVNPYTVAATDF